jgi:hypothetical protein
MPCSQFNCTFFKSIQKRKMLLIIRRIRVARSSASRFRHVPLVGQKKNTTGPPLHPPPSSLSSCGRELRSRFTSRRLTYGCPPPRAHRAEQRWRPDEVRRRATECHVLQPRASLWQRSAEGHVLIQRLCSALAAASRRHLSLLCPGCWFPVSLLLLCPAATPRRRPWRPRAPTAPRRQPWPRA